MCFNIPVFFDLRLFEWIKGCRSFKISCIFPYFFQIVVSNISLNYSLIDFRQNFKHLIQKKLDFLISFKRL